MKEEFKFRFVDSNLTKEEVQNLTKEEWIELYNYQLVRDKEMRNLSPFEIFKLMLNKNSNSIK